MQAISADALLPSADGHANHLVTAQIIAYCTLLLH